MLAKNYKIIPGPRHQQLYGVEVEAELNTEFYNYDASVWTRTIDHSLRGKFPVELVSRTPMRRKKTEIELQRLWDSCITGCASDTARAGTHLHVNMRGISALRLANILTMYYLVEDILVKYGCGKGRFGNLFCLTGSQCPNLTNSLSRMFSYRRLRFKEDHFKYAALNLAAISKFGTIEFRALRTPVKSPSSIIEILKLFSKFQTLSRKYNHPSDIVSELSRNGAEKFVEFLLPAGVKENMKTSVKFEDIHEGLLISQHIAYNSVEF